MISRAYICFAPASVVSIIPIYKFKSLIKYFEIFSDLFHIFNESSRSDLITLRFRQAKATLSRIKNR